MSEEQSTPLSGMMIRGADGALYLIPYEDAAAFRVSETATGTANAVFEGASEHASEVTAVDARHVVMNAHAVFGCNHCWKVQPSASSAE